MEQFGDVLRYARLLGLAGHGEPLAHPDCNELFQRIAGYLDERCESYLITNGVFLDKRAEALKKLNVRTYNISLNAASPATHDVVMGLGSDAFANVVSSVRRLVEHGRSIASMDKRGIDVNLSFVINRDNVHELADFIRLGNELGVNSIYLRTLSNVSSLSPGLNYHLLPPTLHPEFTRHADEAKAAIAVSAAKIVTDVASWNAPVLSRELGELVQLQPPVVIARKHAQIDHSVREAYTAFYEGLNGSGQKLSSKDAGHDPHDDGTNPFNRRPPYSCYFVYHDFIINDFNLRLIPCCYMSSVPEHEVLIFDGSRSFMDYWNSPAYVALRTRLRQGPLYGACRKCPAQDGAC